MADALPKLDRARLRERLLVEFERVVEEVSDAIDEAPAGRVIRDSEEKARDTLDRFRQVVYEQALQGKIDAAEAAFPPSAECGDRQTQTS
jgi:hypothetical protein